MSGKRVWVVEDDADVLEVLRLRLIGWGAQVRGFGHVAGIRAALGEVEPALPDLLLSDQRLPDGTGIEVARLLRAASPALPVLLASGDTSPDDIARLRASGLPVLHKPFTSEELLSALSALGLGDLRG